MKKTNNNNKLLERTNKYNTTNNPLANNILINLPFCVCVCV